MTPKLAFTTMHSTDGTMTGMLLCAAKSAAQLIITYERVLIADYTIRSTGMYYGGDPPAWTNEPKLPKEALFDDRPEEGR